MRGRRAVRMVVGYEGVWNRYREWMDDCLRGEVVRRVDIEGICTHWDTRLRKLL